MGALDLAAEEIHDTIRRHGWAACERAVEPGALDTLKDELAAAISRLEPYQYPFGEQRRITASEILEDQRFPVTTKALMSGTIAEVCTLYGARADSDLIVWSHEFEPDPSAIYGRPHFDRRHQLKAFLYLDDVAEENGPTHVADEAPEAFHERWVASWRKALGMTLEADEDVVRAARRTPEGSDIYRSVECEVETQRSSFRPLVGGAGTVVFFDTSLAHFGGLVSGASSRRTVRRHCLLD
jgi:hypothetical protein